MSQSKYVISGGKFIGKFQELYEIFPDPWGQSSSSQILDSRRQIAILACQKFRASYDATNVVELGCGFGHLTGQLIDHDFQALGIDLSQEAIRKAKELYPGGQFEQTSFDNWELFKKQNIDIFIMAEITWYVLDQLDEFLDNLRDYAEKRKQPTFLIHLLTTYEPGIQEYGKEKFTNLEEILKYFNLEYLEYGFVCKLSDDNPNSQGTYFISMLS